MDIYSWLRTQWDTAEINTNIAPMDPTWRLWILTDLAAKRRILAEHADYNGTCTTCSGDQEWKAVLTPCPTIRLLALPLAGNHGYQPEWRI